MMAFPLIFTSPIALLIAILLGVAIVAVAWRRRLVMGGRRRGLFLAAIALLALAAGGPAWEDRSVGEVAVIVDTSASTRGATFLDEAARNERLRQILMNRDFSTVDWDGVSPLPIPPRADAVVLFTDGRALVDDSPVPIYAAADPALENPIDASIESMEWREDGVAITITNQGPPSRLVSPVEAPVPANASLTRTTSVDVAQPVTAQLSAGDRWPENDVMTLPPLPPPQVQRWWVSASAAEGYRHLHPDELPTADTAYLDVSLIVLDNIHAGELTEAQQRTLDRYVRDLGGALLILGGDRAFAAGAYSGTALDALSPLASHPPAPTTRWIVLVDASGSMSAAFDGQTRWTYATRAVQAALKRLPPADPVSVGSFAETIRWWIEGAAAADARSIDPPADIAPHGPTNLQAALEAITTGDPPHLPTQVVVITDAEASLDRADALASAMEERRIQVNVVLAGESPPDAPLAELVKATGGAFAVEPDPRQWASAAQQLTLARTRIGWIEKPSSIDFNQPLANLPDRPIAGHSAAWLKAGATLLARAGGGDQPLAARWNLGAGVVAAVAFVPGGNELDAISNLIEQPAQDPRFDVTWMPGSRLRVVIDAADASQIYNDRAAVLHRTDATYAFVQTAPGRYEVSLGALPVPSIATVRIEGQTISRRALAGHYAAEFDAIGNDARALRALANRTGGEYVEPGRTRPIDFRFPIRRRSLTATLAACAFAFLAAGLLAGRDVVASF